MFCGCLSIFCINLLIDFYTLHGMQTRSSDENSVHPFVCQRVHCGKMEETSVQIFIPYQRLFSLRSEKKNG